MGDDLSYGLNTLGPLCLWQCLFVFVFVCVFLLARECLLITVITCLTGDKSLRVRYGIFFFSIVTLCWGGWE